MNLFASELLKLRTVRSPYVLLVVTMLFSALVAALLVGTGSLGEDRAFELAQGANFWTLLVIVVGILIVTNEYRHGTVMTTFLAEPSRARVLAAKLATSLVTGAVFALGATLAIAAVAVPWLAARGEELPLDAQGLEAAGRLVLAFALAAALGAAVGAIVQNQVGAIVAVFVWFLIAESIVGLISQLVLADLGEHDPVSTYLPGSALQGIVGGQATEFMLRGGYAILVSLGYVAALAVLGAVSMTRRDP